MGGIQRVRKGERPPVFRGSVAVEERMEAMAIGPQLFRAGRGSHARRFAERASMSSRSRPATPTSATVQTGDESRTGHRASQSGVVAT